MENENIRKENQGTKIDYYVFYVLFRNEKDQLDWIVDWNLDLQIYHDLLKVLEKVGFEVMKHDFIHSSKIPEYEDSASFAERIRKIIGIKVQEATICKVKPVLRLCFIKKHENIETDNEPITASI